MPTSPPRVAYVITDAASLVLLTGELTWLHHAGYRLCVIGSGVASASSVDLPEAIERRDVALERRLAPGRDLQALVALWRSLRAWRPDIVHVSTPKAGLLGGLAARFAGIPHRVYLVRGLRYETARGRTRAILLAAERVALRCATRVHAISRSVVAQGVADGLAELAAAHVIGEGSSKGVDARHFAARDAPGVAVDSAKHRFGLAEGPVIGFVGRIARDKGCADLLDAFDQVAAVQADAQLLVIGAADETDPVPPAFWQRARRDPRVRVVGPLPDVRDALYAMDVLALPSYREGFGNVVLEAAATGIPAVGYRSTGLVDAIEDGVTGTLASRGDRAALAGALLDYLTDPEQRVRHGRAARDRAETRFRPEDIWARVDGVYRAMLAS